MTINSTAALCTKVVIVIVDCNDALIKMIKQSYEYLQEKVLEENKNGVRKIRKYKQEKNLSYAEIRC